MEQRRDLVWCAIQPTIHLLVRSKWGWIDKVGWSSGKAAGASRPERLRAAPEGDRGNAAAEGSEALVPESVGDTWDASATRDQKDYDRIIDENGPVARQADPTVGGQPKSKSRRKWVILGIVGVLPVAYVILTLPNWLLLTRGDLVDIGGRSMFISCQGSGTPTVVLEHGLDSVGTDWSEVQDAVAEDTRVCFYSRAGMGFSGRADEPVRTAQDAADDLTLLLEEAELAGPYVLVGHSFGGLVARLYADQHSGDVVGMVLVDTSHEEQLARYQERLSAEAWAIMSQVQGDNAENMDLAASGEEVAKAGGLEDLPLVVIRAEAETVAAEDVGVPQAIVDEVNRVTNELKPILQQDLAEQSTNSELIIAEGSGHFVHLDRPDVVIDAIRGLLSP